MGAGFEPVLTEDGSWTLAHPEHGEACHSLHGAWEEALLRYARPCRLAELAASRREARASSGAPVRLLDVGTGLGLNLAAALAECGDVPLEVVTLESDPRVVRAGLELPCGPADAAPFQLACRQSLAAALAAPGRAVPLGAGRVRLLLGDGCATLAELPARPQFDAVFLDPFSPARGRGLWEREFLSLVAARMQPAALLSTYTSSLTVRVELARAGLAVGRGPRVGTKGSGTLASLPRGSGGEALPALDPRTQRRLDARVARSGPAGPKAPPLGGEMDGAFA